MTQPPCTASITNEYSRGTHHCVLEAGHQDPEWGGDHASAENEDGLTFRWRDTAIGAVPHQTASQPESAAPSYDHAVGHATDPAPGDHHHGQADAVLAVRDQELEQLRAERDELRDEITTAQNQLHDMARKRGEWQWRAEEADRRLRIQRQRAETAEAAIDRVRDELSACDDDEWMVRAGDIRAALDPQEQP